MTRFAPSLILALLCLVTACKEIDKLTQFNMDYNATVIVPSSSGVNLPFNLFTPDIETNAESEFAINDTRKDLVEEIVLTEMVLHHLSPDSGDFNFLASIEIFIKANDLPEVRIAWKDEVPQDAGKQINLQTSDADLKAYIKKDKFTLRLNTVTDEFLGSDQKIEIRSVFFVDAKVLGV